jgi:Glycosyltransferase 61
MVGDHVPIRTRGSGWRPPEWLTRPTRHESPERIILANNADSEHDIPVEGRFQRKARERQKRATRCSADGLSIKTYKYYDEEAALSRSGELRRRHLLKPPYRPWIARRVTRHPKLTFQQRIGVLSLSICVGVLLLSLITSSLSSKLDALQSQLEARSGVTNSALNHVVVPSPSAPESKIEAHSPLNINNRDGRSTFFTSGIADSARRLPTVTAVSRTLRTSLEVTRLIYDLAAKESANPKLFLVPSLAVALPMIYGYSASSSRSTKAVEEKAASDHLVQLQTLKLNLEQKIDEILQTQQKARMPQGVPNVRFDAVRSPVEFDNLSKFAQTPSTNIHARAPAGVAQVGKSQRDESVVAQDGPALYSGTHSALSNRSSATPQIKITQDGMTKSGGNLAGQQVSQFLHLPYFSSSTEHLATSPWQIMRSEYDLSTIDRQHSNAQSGSKGPISTPGASQANPKFIPSSATDPSNMFRSTPGQMSNSQKYPYVSSQLPHNSQYIAKQLPIERTGGAGLAVYQPSLVLESGRTGTIRSKSDVGGLLSSSGMWASGSGQNGLQGIPFHRRADTSVLKVPDAIEQRDAPGGKTICRTFRACRLQNGTMLVPQWMQRHSDVLKEKCGLNNLAFLLRNDAQPGNLYAVVEQNARFPHGLNLSLNQVGRDLFADAVPRDHMPHFVTDILRTLAAVELLLGEAKYNAKTFQLKPEFRGSEAVSGTTSAVPEIAPTIQLFAESKNRPRTDWVPKVLEMFTTAGFELASAGKEKIKGHEKQERSRVGSCFRSIVTSNLKPYEPNGIFDRFGNNIVLSRNKISREDPARSLSKKQTPCPIAITTLTRQGPRSLLSIQDLRVKIQSMGLQRGVAPFLRVVDFSDMSFENQVQVMQSTDVLITAHGAGNSNFMFMRPRAAVVEIFPFAYKAGPFDGFAQVFGLDYSFVMSAPQTDVFKECMNRHEKNNEIKANVFALWDQAVIQNLNSPGEHQLKFETEFGRPGKSDGMTTRGCVRMQELQFDANRVATMAIESGLRQCRRARGLEP